MCSSKHVHWTFFEFYSLLSSEINYEFNTNESTFNTRILNSCLVECNETLYSPNHRVSPKKTFFSTLKLCKFLNQKFNIENGVDLFKAIALKLFFEVYNMWLWQTDIIGKSKQNFCRRR